MNKANKISLLSLIAISAIGITTSVVVYAPRGNLSNAQNNENVFTVTWDKGSEYQVLGGFYSKSSSGQEVYLEKNGCNDIRKDGALTEIYSETIEGETFSTTLRYVSGSMEHRNKISITELIIEYYWNNSDKIRLDIYNFAKKEESEMTKALESYSGDINNPKKVTYTTTSRNDFNCFEFRIFNPSGSDSCSIKSITMTYKC